MAAEESAQFHRWSATTNVDDTVLEQMTADVADLAWSGQIDPAAVTYARLLGARDDVFRLIVGHQQPHHTTTLYKIASQICAMLALAANAPNERTPDEPGVLGLDPASAAMYASEAHYTLGGVEHLDAAIDLARTAVDEFTTEDEPKAMYIAGARFVLAHAYLGKGHLDAVGEHLAPILRATGAEYRTVPIIGRARSLHALLDQRSDLTSATLTTLRDDLAGFITHPAPSPPQLEPGIRT